MIRFFKKFFCIMLLLVGAKSGLGKEYRVLVLPSGGATGIISAVSLVELERQTGRPIYQQFDEIWGSSIGAMMAALLTVPRHDRAEPKSASEVLEFLEQAFASCWRASGILKAFSKNIPLGFPLKDTKIPIRILSAEIKDWMSVFPIPSRTELKVFCPEREGGLPLPSLVCSSCVLPPIHWYEKIVSASGEIFHYLDAGHEFCTEQCMNPLYKNLEVFSKKINAQEDRVSLFFLSNGWVRLPSWYTEMTPVEDNPELKVKLFNLDMDLSAALEVWRRDHWFGKMLGCVESPYILYNLAGIGLIPSSILKRHAQGVLQDSRVLRAMIEDLRQKEDVGDQCW
jgi:hypothetical protein